MVNDAITVVGDMDELAASRTLAAVSLVPRSVGRYLLIEEIGKGGMGAVYSAFDPELERRVAIKLIDARAEPRARLRREAQAIARVTHPNVIAVYDVGEFEFIERRGVYMVMEMVEGADLRAWAGERRRSVAELLGVYVQAGRGLDAAHRKGVVHRDFKPANVLVAREGRVLVLDFGLARGLGQGEVDEHESAATLESAPDDSTSGARASASSSQASVSSLSAPLTRHGAVIGTPRFMSPEQHQTSIVDARSDQYSFCLALYIDLYRRLPFDESSFEALVDDKLAGIRDWDAPHVPAHVRAALQRGLHPDPDQRWPDMAGLVAALADDPRVRRRRVLALGLGLTMLAGSIGGAIAWDRHALAQCAERDAWLAGAWDEPRRAALIAAYDASGRSYAATARERALHELDAYADTLARIQADVCEDRHRERVEPDIAAARSACLEQRRERLGAMAEQLGNADARIVEHTVELLGALPAAEPCATIDTPLVEREVDPAARQAIERELFELELLAAAGDQPAALAGIAPVLTRARELDDPHTLMVALLQAGNLHAAARKQPEAEALLGEAARLAERKGDHDIAIDALLGLALTLEDMRGRWDEAQRVLGLALAKYEHRAGGSAGRWRFHYAQAGIHNQQKRREQARVELELALTSARVDQGAMTIAKILHALAMTETDLDLLEAAERHARESIELRIGVYGPDHPSLMYPLRALARIAGERKQPEQALVHLDRAIALGETRHGRDAPGLIEPHTDRAKALRQLARFDEALAEYVEAERLARANGQTAEEHLRMQSQLLVRLDRPSEALERAELALAEHRRVHGPDEQVPWLRARFFVHRGEALLANGRAEAALLDFRRAAELRALEDADGLLLRAWVGEGESELALARPDAARNAFERARAHREAGHDDGELTSAWLDFGLAKVAADPAERVQLCTTAIAGFEAAGDRVLAERVRAWLTSPSTSGQSIDHRDASLAAPR
jgi:tetratricopeptide (TPR) repeat protein/tRNA A-37 threonylcarbamoyl transferase component Bud32